MIWLRRGRPKRLVWGMCLTRFNYRFIVSRKRPTPFLNNLRSQSVVAKEVKPQVLRMTRPTQVPLGQSCCVANWAPSAIDLIFAQAISG